MLTRRLQAHANAAVASILASTDTLALDIDWDFELINMIGLSKGACMALATPELRGALDLALDDTFPALIGVKVNGATQWHRVTRGGEWRRGTAE